QTPDRIGGKVKQRCNLIARGLISTAKRQIAILRCQLRNYFVRCSAHRRRYVRDRTKDEPKVFCPCGAQKQTRRHSNQSVGKPSSLTNKRSKLGAENLTECCIASKA